MGDSDTWLEVSGLTVERIRAWSDRGIGLRRVSLSLEQGEILALAGESGSGRSFLARLLAGAPDPGARVLEGRVRLDGEEVLAADPRRRPRGRRSARIALVSKEPLEQFNPDRSVRRCLGDWVRSAAANGEGGDAAWSEFFHTVGIVEPERILERMVRDLPGLMIQRLALMRALVGGAELIICDEASATLDRIAEAQFIELIRQIRDERGAAFLVTTGSLRGVERFADRVAVFYEGGVLESGEARRVVEAPRHRYTREFLDCLPRLSRAPGDLPAISREAAREAEATVHDQEATFDPSSTG